MLTSFLLLKLSLRNVDDLFFQGIFFLLNMLFIFVNPLSQVAWSNVIMSELAILIAIGYIGEVIETWKL